MIITEVRLGRISVPLRVPFKTALRTVSSVEDIIVEIHTDTGHVGYGEAPPTGAITGDTTGAIIGALKDHIIKNILGKDVEEFEPLLQLVQKNRIIDLIQDDAVTVLAADRLNELLALHMLVHQRR